MKQNQDVDLSIVIPALHEAENLYYLLPQIHDVLSSLNIQVEVIIVDEFADENTTSVASEYQAILLQPETRGYGNALLAGFRYSHGNYIVTMDADLSHPPEFLRVFWEARDSADVLIASRYVKGGKAIMPFTRFILSKILNVFFSRGLDLGIKDMSSGYRMYSRKTIIVDNIIGTNFNILQELLVKSLANGFQYVKYLLRICRAGKVLLMREYSSLGFLT